MSGVVWTGIVISAGRALQSGRGTELYVPTFRNNYTQMKIDGAKTYGKVFEDDGRDFDGV